MIVAAYPLANEVIRQVAEQQSCVFVSGYEALPPNLKYLTDIVRLTNKGMDTLASKITDVLLDDQQFEQVVSRVRGTSNVALDCRSQHPPTEPK